MEKTKKSGPAIFMYCVIAIAVITSIICFTLYYGDFYKKGVILWTGITAFTIMYHFWVRIIMGNVSKLFKKHINYKQWWFKEKKFEKGFYEFMDTQYPEVGKTIKETGQMDERAEEKLKEGIEVYKKDFIKNL